MLAAVGGAVAGGDGGPDATAADAAIDHGALADGGDADVAVPMYCPPDGGALPPCPSTAPADGETCGAMGQQCEYGSSFELECDRVVTCDCTGHWSTKFDGVSSCTFTAQGCPASAPSPADAGSCNAGTLCDYGSSECTCTVGGGGGGAPVGSWLCVGDRSDAGCPWPRPRAGVPCSDPSAFCLYAYSCTPGWDMVCSGGEWQPVPGPPCP